MAKAFHCDRCKELFQGEHHGTVTIRKNTHFDNDEYNDNPPKELELCQPCYIKVDKFLVV